MTEMCSDGIVTPNDRGGQGFFRKRKKGYWRAYKRGVYDRNVLRFVSEAHLRGMMDAMFMAYRETFFKDLLEPSPLFSSPSQSYAPLGLIKLEWDDSAS